MQIQGWKTPEEIISGIVDEVSRFAGKKPIADDQALLVLAIT